MYRFCTYFDRRYLPRGLALYRSLRAHCHDFELWILCLDDPCRDVLRRLSLPGVRLVGLDELESADPELARARPTRTLIEYYYTCTPAFAHMLLSREGMPSLTYLDADLYFFSDPESVFDELGEGSVAITPHRFPPGLRRLACHGEFNVGWITFRNDSNGRACLSWWRERCIEWCYERLENGRFADQKYLDEWPRRFRGVVAIRHKGANLAPWNVGRYRLRRNGRNLWVEDQPLVFYHFHRFRQITPWLFDPNLQRYRVRLTPLLRRAVYEPYIRAVLEAQREIAPHYAEVSLSATARNESDAVAKRSFAKRMHDRLSFCKGLAAGKCIFYWNGHGR